MARIETVKVKRGDQIVIINKCDLGTETEFKEGAPKKAAPKKAVKKSAK